MAISLNLSIFDVDEQPLGACRVQIEEFGTKLEVTQDAINVFRCTPNPAPITSDIVITVTNDLFFSETILIRRSQTDSVTQPRVDWTNPTTTVLVTRANSPDFIISVRVALSRIQLAKLVPLSGARPPGGVLLKPGTKPGDFRYDKQEDLARTDFRIFGERILNEDPAQRITFDPVKPDPSAFDKGYFRWLETGPTGKKYAVAIWVPKNYFADASTIQERAIDFVVIFSPTTRDKPMAYTLKNGHNYPYGLNDGTLTKGSPHQPFISTLGQEYLFQRLHFSIQLIAAKRKAVIVMPINDLGDWGPFASKSGLHRLLLEIMHRIQHDLLFLNSKQEFDLDAFNRLNAQARQIPGIRRVVLAGFSGAAKPLLGFFNEQPTLHPTVSARNSKTRFDDLWKEIWDLDMALGLNIKSAPTWTRRFLDFFVGGAERRVRMYHGDYTAGPRDKPQPWRPTHDPELKKYFPNDADARKKLGTTILDGPLGTVAEEYYLDMPKGGELTTVYLSTPFLEKHHNTPGTIPPFPLIKGDRDLILHSYIPNYALAHAARHSKLEPLR